MAVFTPSLASGRLTVGAGVAELAAVFSPPRKLRVSIVQTFAAGRPAVGAGVAELAAVFSPPRKLRVNVVQAFAAGRPSAQQGLDLSAQFRRFGSLAPPASVSTTVSGFYWG